MKLISGSKTLRANGLKIQQSTGFKLEATHFFLEILIYKDQPNKLC